jgi:hypothetical protein
VCVFPLRKKDIIIKILLVIKISEFISNKCILTDSASPGQSGAGNFDRFMKQWENTAVRQVPYYLQKQKTAPALQQIHPNKKELDKISRNYLQTEHFMKSGDVVLFLVNLIQICGRNSFSLYMYIACYVQVLRLKNPTNILSIL